MEKLRSSGKADSFYIRFSLSGDTKLNAFDLSVILNNAMDKLHGKNVSGENPYISILLFENSIL